MEILKLTNENKDSLSSSIRFSHFFLLPSPSLRIFIFLSPFSKKLGQFRSISNTVKYETHGRKERLKKKKGRGEQKLGKQKERGKQEKKKEERRTRVMRKYCRKRFNKMRENLYFHLLILKCQIIIK